MYQRFNLLLLKVHNLSGISSLKYENKKFSVSIPFVVFNISHLIILLFLRHWVHRDRTIIVEVLEETFLIHEESHFLRTIYLFAHHFTYFFGTFSVLINLIRQQKIASFLNDCVSVKISDAYMIKFQRDVKISSSLIFFYHIFDFFVQFVTYFKFSFSALIFNYIEAFPYLIMLNILIAMKNFEMLLLAALEQIASDLKFAKSFEIQAKRRHLQRLMKKYQKLCGLCDEFNKVFGVQLTSMTCFNIVIFIFRVIDNNLMFCWK